ncbi:hypothetical protein V2G26_016689 [Clonostachys chloroleuca]
MTSPPDHRQMVSLRGEEYVFELKGMMPDGLIEMYRQLYMDSFLMFVLPVDAETIGNFRAKSVRKVLNVLTVARSHKIPSDVLSMRIDKTVWTWMFMEYLPQCQVEPEFPWPIPRADPAAPPAPMLQAWRRKMGLSCEDETQRDSSSTDSMLSNVVRLSTQEKVQEFLEEQQLTQWYTTRATLPKKPVNSVHKPQGLVNQGSRVSLQERSASRGRAQSRSRDHSRATIDAGRLVRLMDGHMEDTMRSFVTTALHLGMSIGAIDQGRHLGMNTGAIDQDHRTDMEIKVDEQQHLDAVRNRPSQGQELAIRSTLAGLSSVTKAQSNATAPVAAMLSFGGDLDGSTATSQPVTTTPATVTSSNN